MNIRAVSAGELARQLDSGRELALLDPREEGVFARGHLLFAVPVPLSRVEERIGLLVPRRATPVIVCGDDPGLAAGLVARLAALGYGDVAMLEGGDAAWQRAGHRLFGGIYVPSKAFGEHIEHACDTPRIEPAELRRLIDGGTKMMIFDSRPLAEFRRMSIPGARCCPGADLVYRVPAAVNDPDMLVVVNCAGRTRSIIGAQSLINAGLPNRVVALKNGTMGWHLAGQSLSHGESDTAPEPDATGLAQARRMAASVAGRFGVKRIGRNALDAMLADTGRTLYRFDVRGPQEYAAGHVAGFVNAPGGQLVQATDRYMGTRNARVVLVDDEDVRAIMTASWLLQMGWPEVFVIDREAAGPGPGSTDRAAERGRVGGAIAADIGAEEIGPEQLRSLLAAGSVALVDLATSGEHYDAHIEGARFAIRARFDGRLRAFANGRPLVLTSPDGTFALIAATDAARAAGVPVRVLRGGTAAWTAAGHPVVTGFADAIDLPEDMWHTPSSALGGGEPAMREYLSWEVDLLEQVKREPGVRFSDGTA